MSEPIDLDLQKAAQCWCDPRTKNVVMIPELATVFAEKLSSERRALMEKFRPIAEVLEWVKSAQGNPDMDINETGERVRLGLIRWRALEKENGQ